MATKTITVTEEAYGFLKSLKKGSESFSDTFIRLAKEKDVATKYFGVLKGDISEVQKRVKALRQVAGKSVEERKGVLSRYIRGS